MPQHHTQQTGYKHCCTHHFIMNNSSNSNNKHLTQVYTNKYLSWIFDLTNSKASSWHFALLASILDQVSKGSASNCRSKLKPYCWFWSQCTKSVIVSILSTLLPAAWWCIWTFHGRTLLISRRTQVHPPRPQLRAKVNKKLEWNGPSEGVRVSGVVI